MRCRLIALCLVFPAVVFAQADRGTITGGITLRAGTVVPGDATGANNMDMGSAFPMFSPILGNHTPTGLPFGIYELTATITGFKKYLRFGLIVQLAPTLRLDFAVDTGSAWESATLGRKTRFSEKRAMVSLGEVDPSSY